MVASAAFLILFSGTAGIFTLEAAFPLFPRAPFRPSRACVRTSDCEGFFDARCGCDPCSFNSCLSRLLKPFSIALCWILPTLPRVAWAALARARISAYEPFLGGLTGSAADALTAPVPLEVGGLTLTFEDDATVGRGFATAGRLFAGFLIGVVVVVGLATG